MFLTQKNLSRRTVLKGMGVTLALPMLEAMVPAKSAFAAASNKKIRLVAIEMVHGAAGSSAYVLGIVNSAAFRMVKPEAPKPLNTDVVER